MVPLEPSGMFIYTHFITIIAAPLEVESDMIQKLLNIEQRLIVYGHEGMVMYRVVQGEKKSQVYPSVLPVFKFLAKNIVTKNLFIFQRLEQNINLGTIG